MEKPELAEVTSSTPLFRMEETTIIRDQPMEVTTIVSTIIIPTLVPRLRNRSRITLNVSSP